MCDICGRVENAPASSIYSADTPGVSETVPNQDTQPCPTACCHFCCCTVCGQHRTDVATVSCTVCQARTHITCARDVLTTHKLVSNVDDNTASSSNRWRRDARGDRNGNHYNRHTTCATRKGADKASASPLHVDHLNKRNKLVPTHAASGAGATPSPTASAQTRTTIDAATGATATPAASCEDKATSFPSTSLLSAPPPAPASRARAECMQLAQIQRKPYFCSVDCVMGVQLFVNAQFSAGISAAVERQCARRWSLFIEAARAGCWPAGEEAGVQASAPSAGPAGVGSAPSTARKRAREMGHGRFAAQPDEQQSMDGYCGAASERQTDHDTHPSEATKEGASDVERAVYPFTEIADPARRQGYMMAYVQLRYESWCAYYAREMRTHAHPLFVLPAYLEMDDRLYVHLNQLMCPRGQAQRLCQLDPRSHPIGSAIALPQERLWRSAERFGKGETNCFVAESMSAVLDDVAEVSVFGKRIHSSHASSGGSTGNHGGRGGAVAIRDVWGFARGTRRAPATAHPSSSSSPPKPAAVCEYKDVDI